MGVSSAVREKQLPMIRKQLVIADRLLIDMQKSDATYAKIMSS